MCHVDNTLTSIQQKLRLALTHSCISLWAAAFLDSDLTSHTAEPPMTAFELCGKPYDSTTLAFQITAIWEIPQSHIGWGSRDVVLLKLWVQCLLSAKTDRGK